MTAKSATDIDRTVGLRITTMRKAKGLSQSELGKAIGVTFQQVQKYERGVNRVSGGRLQQVAQVLGVPLSALFGEDEPEGQSEVFASLAETGAVDLLRAYASIQDADLRKHVLVIVRTAMQMSVGPIEGNA
ncbi:MAG: helix-turn-helix transcriptional regulator [Beijerinckiaceae bacterium]|nr:helix-turn-helix transcriptional regulator [Beijerinckiaceae bacterium]